ncbi:phage portal protein [Paenibacillus sanguinis]|uniref:phage portal protein n=1 Tax=Paenibacillus sanguinis TaxID=225906 RepID=UPI0003723388|nr:phage portal protein [Paenibacillus sanguinis]
MIESIKVRPGTAPTNELVTKIISVFCSRQLPHYRKLEGYYRSQNEIRSRRLAPEKPNNRIAHGFAKYITDMATGYFMGEGIRVSTEDEEYQEHLLKVLEQNTAADTNFETAKEASKKGISYELLYLNEQADIRFKRFSAEDIIPVYSFSVGEFLEFAVRIWTERDLITNKNSHYAEVYTKDEIIIYAKNGSIYREQERLPHYFGDVPMIVYWNNEEQSGDYEDVIDLIDAYDKAQSDTANDFEYFTDAYLVLIGAGAGLVKAEGDSDDDQDAIRTLKQERVLLLDQQGQAQWLVKQINDTAVENFKNRVRDDIFFLAKVPALTDESFAGNLSGVAIRYKLIGLEQLAAIKENKFLPAYRKKIRLITSQLNLRLSRSFDPSSVEVKFDRNMTDNLAELADVILKLRGSVSKQTLLELLPFVKDAPAELQQLLDELQQEDELGNVNEDLIGVGDG